MHHGDVTEISVGDVLERTGLNVDELELFNGSPPCQGFSTSGKRRINDPCNTLFREYVRLLGGLRPRTFVMENVSGMVKGKMKVVFAEVLRELRRCGYAVSARLLNAKWYGVPQSRPRLIFVGVRKDLAAADLEPSHPIGWGPPLTARQALARLPEDAGHTLGELDYWIWSLAKPLEIWGRHPRKGHWFNSSTLDPDKPTSATPSPRSGWSRGRPWRSFRRSSATPR